MHTHTHDNIFCTLALNSDILVTRLCCNMFQPLKRMVDRIRRFQVLNSQIFSVLSRHLAADDERSGVEHVRCYPPPAAHHP